MKKFPIIKNSMIWIALAVVSIAVALWFFFTNLRPSIQFTWGLEIVVDQELTASTIDQLKSSLNDEWYTDFQVTLGKKDQLDSVLVQGRLWSNDQVWILSDFVQDTLISQWDISDKDDIVESTNIGPSIGDNITKSSKTAIIRWTILMAVYILFSFAGMRKVISPVLLAGVTIVTMLFDVSIASGAYGVLMMLNESIQVDMIFIIALLTVMWYSINDTIIIFDRIRENALDIIGEDDEEDTQNTDMNFRSSNTVKKSKKKKPTVEFDRLSVFEKSVRQTMRRSLATSFSTLMVVIAMYIFGTGILKMFAFTLWVWVIAGTYSSIFVAAPLAYVLSKAMENKETE